MLFWDFSSRAKDIRAVPKPVRFDLKPSPATFGTLLKAYGQRVDQTNVFRRAAASSKFKAV